MREILRKGKYCTIVKYKGRIVALSNTKHTLWLSFSDRVTLAIAEWSICKDRHEGSRVLL